MSRCLRVRNESQHIEQLSQTHLLRETEWQTAHPSRPSRVVQAQAHVLEMQPQEMGQQLTQQQVPSLYTQATRGRLSAWGATSRWVRVGLHPAGCVLDSSVGGLGLSHHRSLSALR